MASYNNKQPASDSDEEFQEQLDLDFKVIGNNKNGKDITKKESSLLSPENSVDMELIKGSSLVDPNIFPEIENKETSSKESSFDKSKIFQKSNSQIRQENDKSRDRIYESSDNDKTPSSELNSPTSFPKNNSSSQNIPFASSNQLFQGNIFYQQIQPRNNSQPQNLSASASHSFQRNIQSQFFQPAISTISKNQFETNHSLSQAIGRKNPFQATKPAQNRVGNSEMPISVEMKDDLKNLMLKNNQMDLDREEKQFQVQQSIQRQQFQEQQNRKRQQQQNELNFVDMMNDEQLKDLYLKQRKKQKDNQKIIDNRKS